MKAKRHHRIRIVSYISAIIIVSISLGGCRKIVDTPIKSIMLEGCDFSGQEMEHVFRNTIVDMDSFVLFCYLITDYNAAHEGEFDLSIKQIKPGIKYMKVVEVVNNTQKIDLSDHFRCMPAGFLGGMSISLGEPGANTITTLDFSNWIYLALKDTSLPEKHYDFQIIAYMTDGTTINSDIFSINLINR